MKKKDQLTVVALDTETHLMSHTAPAPKVVCVSLAMRQDENTVVPELLAAHEPATLDILRGLFSDDNTLLVGHYMAYDLTVIQEMWPELCPLIWDKLEKGLITDTRIRESILNLSEFGSIENLPLPDGQTKRILYHLSDLEKAYCGIDRSDQKEGDDIWRLRYSELDGVAIADYPEEARDYAMDDAVGTLLVYEAQDGRSNPGQGPGSMNTHEFQTAVDYALRRMTCNGVRIDREHRDELAAALAVDLAESNMPRLIGSGILRPAEAPRPFANQRKRLATLFPDGDWTLEDLAEAGIKVTQYKKPSIDTKALHDLITTVCEENGLEVKMTVAEKPRVCADAGVLSEIAHLDPILKEYQDRQKLVRLAGTELPKLDADRVFPNYDILKETGRTSSKGNTKGTMDPYPSTNIQQVDPRARNCFIPDEGCVFCSVDYSGMELASLAQKCYELFGYSVHRDKLMRGYDLHAYLASQLAFHLDPAFGDECAECSSPDEIYEKFMAKKETDSKFFKHWRKFAKPVGLGYPGGLGHKTFITFAAGVYDVVVDEATAKRLKEVWLVTYPEMVDYFRYISLNAVDPFDGESYCYETPLGMWRAQASYCATANGMGLQSPSAEGAKAAVFAVMRACDDPQDILYGCKPFAFVHDEIIANIPDSDKKSKIALRIGEIMVDYMKLVFRDVPIEVEPALMRKWDKKAEPVYSKSGELQIWEPKEE